MLQELCIFRPGVLYKFEITTKSNNLSSKTTVADIRNFSYTVLILIFHFYLNQLDNKVI